MASLTLAVGGFWGTIFEWAGGFIPGFALTVILFTIVLKLILSPLEIYQKITTKKQSEMQAKLQPELNKLQKRFANNKEMLNQKTAELYKRENFNIVGSCLGIVINLAITLIVFITLFTSLNQISQEKIKTEYSNLTQTYSVTFVSNAQEQSNGVIVVDSTDTISSVYEKINSSGLTETEKEELITNLKNISKLAASDKYTEIKESFLWIKNVYRPDTYASVFPSANEYLNISNTNFKNVSAENKFTDIYGIEYSTAETAQTAFINEYNDITGNINEVYNGWNGYLILVILAAAITILSQLITTKATKAKKQYDKRGNEIEIKQPSGKLLLFLLPALMIWFTLQYSAVFALYIVINSLMSLIISLITGVVINAKEKRKESLN